MVSGRGPLRPLHGVQPAVASSATEPQLRGLAALDAPERAVTIYLADPPGGDAGLWGGVDDVTRMACGTYVPLAQEPSGGLDVQVQLPRARLCGSAAHPLRIKVDGRPEGEGAARPAGAKTGPGVVLLLAQMTMVTQSEGAETWGYERFCVINEAGVAVLETDRLEGGTWLAKTSVAEETDLRLRCSVGAAPPASAVAAGNLPRPLPAPGLADNVLQELKVWIIALEGARESNVERLEEALRRSLAPLVPDVPMRRFKAWDTRGLSSGTVRALCHELALNRQIFSREEVLLKTGGSNSEDVHSEAVHKRASKILGCAVSHSDLWYQLATGKGAGPWVILEDDAVLNESRPIAAVLRSALATFAAGSWDLLLLGNVSPEEKPWDYVSPCTLGPASNFIGFWGYVISKQGALRALSLIWGTEEEPKGLRGDIDVECARGAQHKHLSVLTCLPHLVFHPQCGLDPSLPSTQVARRHRCRPAGYQYRTIQVVADFEFDTTRTGLDEGEGEINMRLVRQIASRLRDFRRATGQAGGAGAKDEADGDAEDWVVAHARVAKRAEASTQARAVGMALAGARVRGALRLVDGVEWLEVRDHGCKSLPEGQSAWMLVDGGSVGLGRLLERAPPAD